MKRFFAVILFLLMTNKAHAVVMDIWLSSNTATADTTQVLCGQYAVGGTTSTLKGVIHEVVVSSPSAGSVTLYNSSFTATAVQSIGPVTTGGISQSSVSPYLYDVIFPGGLIYSKTGTAQVQILYQCY